MAKAKAKPDPGKWEDPGMFGASLAAVRNEVTGYLGDHDVVKSLLRGVAEEVVEAIATGGDGMTLKIDAAAKKAAKVLLGMDNDYAPVHKWNEPGAIDVFIGKWAGVESADPVERVAGGLLDMASELNDVILEAVKPDVPPSRWRPAVDAILDSYTELFQGISPAVAAAR